MKERGLNINQFSKLIGYDFQAIARWLDGKYYPRHYVLADLSKFFNHSIDYILGLSDNETFKISENQSNFLERLNICLKRDNISRYRLSKLCNIRQSTISKWFTDGRIPETATLIALAKLFGCSVEYLLGRVNKPY